MTECAWVVVDLVNDFVSGKFGSPGAVEVARKTSSVISQLNGKVELVFTLDTHILNDPEFRVWGEHCVEGTAGSNLYPDLEKFNGFRIRKRHYDAFYNTDLDGYLRDKKIENLYISGISTDICVIHTVAGAFFRRYSVSLIEDLCTSIDPKNHDLAVSYMKEKYGARIIDSSTFVEEMF